MSDLLRAQFTSICHLYRELRLVSHSYQRLLPFLFKTRHSISGLTARVQYPLTGLEFV